ncbi:hypothetical protein H632_c1416p1 [Helicosporidium sp. ATCC 50920]|nr:hypothetical protein H632_c1416p1 [Helicosporidium sp. ATCC 50920]|eukprot:KDD74305.1 hypothetical protein H632_c1416p1 [Helicosporidium sp. ATCC 50920]
MVAVLVPALWSGELFPWHPALMTVGFLGLMTRGILAAVSFRPLEGHPRVSAIQRHAWIQVMAVSCIVLGFWSIYANKSRHNKPHFVTLHGKVGAVNFGATLGALLWGSLSFKKLGLITRFPERYHATIKWGHRAGAVVVWSLSLVTMQLDLPHPALPGGSLLRIWQLLVAATGVSMMFLLRRQTLPKILLPMSVLMGAVQAPAKHL